MAIKTVDSADDDKNYKSDKKKVDYILNKIAVSNMSYGVGAKNIRNVDGETREVETSSK